MFKGDKESVWVRGMRSLLVMFKLFTYIYHILVFICSPIYTTSLLLFYIMKLMEGSSMCSGGLWQF